MSEPVRRSQRTGRANKYSEIINAERDGSRKRPFGSIAAEAGADTGTDDPDSYKRCNSDSDDDLVAYEYLN